VTGDSSRERADVLVFAVWFDPFKQLIAQYGERLAGKVIVDPTNPVGPDGAGGYRKVIGEQESSGQILAGLDQAVRIEMLGDLHEYGALGRVVAKSEALAAV
jgi:predicted dinucleotide-binding enzyme